METQLFLMAEYFYSQGYKSRKESGSYNTVTLTRCTQTSIMGMAGRFGEGVDKKKRKKQ